MSYSLPMDPIISATGLISAPFSQAITFHYLEGTGEDVIKVELWNFADPDAPVPGAPAFVLNVDYEIDEVGNNVDVLTDVPADHKLIIYRESEPIQTSNYINGAFPAESVEEGIDKVALLCQENREKLSRALLTEIGGTPIDITALNAQVATNVTDIATNAANISSNDTDIATNAAGIATNAGNISTNATNIGTNTTNISTNTGNIATNAADIATNAADIAALSPPNIVVTSSNHNAASGDVVILQGNNLIVTLPTPTAAHKVIVKLDGSFPGGTLNATVNGGGNNVDGAATHVMDSEYGSKTFIADGSNWFII